MGWIKPPHEFEKHKKYGFGTPSGKIEIHSSLLEKLGYDPLPDYEEPSEGIINTPQLAKEYPYIFASARPPLFRNACYLDLPSIRKTRPDPLILINPKTAINIIINDDPEQFCDPMLGSWSLNGLLCKIYRT